MLKLVRRLLAVARPIATRRFFYGYAYNLARDIAPIKPKHVLLESFHGKAFWDSPYALLQHLAGRPEFKGWTFVVTAPPRQRRQLENEFPNHRIRFVQPRSIRYAWHLATCMWLINDTTFPLYLSRRKDQHYLNLWHGTPLKLMGRDEKTNPITHITNVQRNFLHATHLLAPNPHTETVLRNAYMLEEFSGEVLQCGYPRNDVLAQSRGKRPPSKDFRVAFMPTWRGQLNTRNRDSREQLAALRALLTKLDASLRPEITLYVKLHPLVAGEIDLQHYSKIRPFPAAISPYEHLANCDLLITDYSSVMFDFALTERPIVLYVPDEEIYRDQRGFYISPDVLPLPKVATAAALAKFINQADAILPANSQYQAFFRKFGEWEHGDSCERICNAFFSLQGNVNRAPAARWQTAGKRRRVLLYTGSMPPNGITRSFKTLLSMIDTKETDYTVLVDTSFDPEGAQSFLKTLPAGIGVIPLSLHVYIGPLDLLKIFWIYFFKRSVQEAPRALVKIWEREHRRLLADSRFDVFVNFNGYSWRAALLALGSTWKRIIYVHNDMALEVDAGKIFDKRLLELSYRTADHVALVREGVEEEYCRRFYDYREKAQYVPNCLRSDVKAKAKRPLSSAIHVKCSADQLERLERMFAREHTHRFINLARFSPEKGQARLVEAFEKFHAMHPESQLFIVGGYGPLLPDLQLRASQSSASDSICVVQGTTNPFPLAQRCDTMVFSSFYEGIGLVLFESLQLGLRVVSTDIPGPREFLQQGYGLVVDNSIDGLVNGMSSALSGDVPFREFDLEAHNLASLRAFESLIH